MAYDMGYPFIIPTMVYEYASAFKDLWGNRASTGVYLLSHCLEVSLRVVAQFQRDSYENCSDDEDIVSCDYTKDLFVKSSYPTLVKRVEEKYEALDRLEKGWITCLNIALDEMFNMSFKNFARYG